MKVLDKLDNSFFSILREAERIRVINLDLNNYKIEEVLNDSKLEFEETLQHSKDENYFAIKSSHRNYILLNESTYEKLKHSIGSKFSDKKLNNFYDCFDEDLDKSIFEVYPKFKYFNSQFLFYNGYGIYIFHDDIFNQIEYNECKSYNEVELKTYLKDKLLNKLRKKLSIDWNIPIEDVDTLLGTKE